MHQLVDAQEIIESDVSPRPAAGFGAIDQAAPFQCSMSGTGTSDPDGESSSPTALHQTGETQATPYSALTSAPGLGLFTLVHVVPFQRSTKVRCPLLGV